MPKSPHSLTAKQEKFVREYLVDLNATQAAIRAKYSEKGAAVQASNLLAMPKIQKRVEELKAEQFKRIEVTADEVLKRFNRTGDYDIAGAYTANGWFKGIHEIPEDLRKCIKSIEIFEEWTGSGPNREKAGEIRKITWHCPTKANELIGRHLKMFTDKLELDTKKGLGDRLAKAIARKKEE